MAKNWTITKKNLEDINKICTNDAFGYILEIFITLLDLKSNKKYRQVKNALKTEGAFQTEAEKEFRTLLPKLIANNRDDDAIILLGLIRRSACLFNWGSKKKSYKTYCRTFVDFLEKFINSKAKNNQFIREFLKNNYSLELSPKDDDILSESFAEHHVYLHDRLQTKFKSRLRSQSRTSGDKVWLPLDFIAKLYNFKRNKGFSEWLDNSVDEIYIHYKDTQGIISSVCFKKDVFLDFQKNNDEKFDVFVIWSKVQEPKRCRVYTPTGNGNEKKPMTVKDISQIDIDHVKPIDLTLRQLNEDNSIPNLKRISDYYRGLDNPEKATIDCNVWNVLGIQDISQVTDELNLIKDKGLLRLMDSSYNEKKSNGTIFDPIIQIGKNSYIGIMGKAKLVENCKEEMITIYQDLSKNGETLASFIENIPKGKPVDISKKLVDYL